ncbi:PR domain zinc finger protein 15-like [Mytilus trossulus]|uniref:PR domain zinc finger protein 15-like n=1 Tax=Mytilus trossulus TaxID=6551 RepID=UPI003005CAE5
MMETPLEGCDVCGEDHATVLCPELGLQNSDLEDVVVTRARLTLPHTLQAVDLGNGEVTVYSTENLCKKTQFGPYEAKRTTHEFNDDGLFVLKILTKDGMNVSLDTTEESECNWMCLVQAATEAHQQNLIAYQLGTSIFYSTTRNIDPGTELHVWYAPQYARRLGKQPNPDGYSKVMLGMKVVYPSVDELAESQIIKNVVEEGSKHLNQPPEEAIENQQMEINTSLEQGMSQTEEDEQQLIPITNYRCRRCGEGFMTEIELGKHIREHINPPGSGRRGRLPKVDKVIKILPKKKKTGKVEKEDTDSCENDEEFTPKSYQMFKVEPQDPTRLRVLPKRRLKGKRTTGFLVDEEFLLTKSQIKTEPEEITAEVHVEIINKDESSSLKRKRGRPSQKSSKTAGSPCSKRKKIFEKEIETEKCIKQSDEPRNDCAGELLEKLDTVNTDDNTVEFQDTDDKIVDDDQNMKLMKLISTAAETNEIIDAPAIQADNDNQVENANAITEEVTSNNEYSSAVLESSEFPSDYLVASNNTIKESEQGKNEEFNKTSEEAGDTEENGKLSAVETEQKEKDGETSSKENMEEETSIEKQDEEISQENIHEEISNEKKDERTSKEIIDEETNIDNIDDEESSDKSSGKSEKENSKNKKDDTKKIHKKITKSKKEKDKMKRKARLLPIPMEVRDTPNGKEYVCTICNKKYNTERYLRLHAPKHTSEFRCETCGKSFARKESLQKHECRFSAKIITKEPTESGQQTEGNPIYSCSKCEEQFYDLVEAENHLQVHRIGITCEHCKQVFLKRVQWNQHVCPDVEKSRYSCDICFQTFGNEQSLFRHVAMHTDIYKCEKCAKCFSRKDSLLRHITTCCPDKAEDYGVFSCRKCSKTFGTKLGLENHEARCSMHCCDACFQVFDTKPSLDEHKCRPLPENSDSSTKQVKFSCSECNKSFKNLHYLLQHKQVHCNSHECEVCGKRLKSQEDKDDHERFCLAVNKIKMEGKIKCDRCGEEFFLAKEYKEHYQTHTHTYHCEKCDKRFVKIGTLHTHQCVTAEGVNCQFCKRDFKSKKTFQLHMVTHSDIVSQCPKCSKYFENDLFDDHPCDVEESKEEESTAKYMCHLCGKNFVSTSNLNKHMKVHGDKSISCPYCDKKFHYPEYLKVHIAGVHEKKTQYQCSECGKILTSKPGLVSHMKLFHCDAKEVYPCPECGKCFSQKGNMKTHMFSHGKERTFQCTFCTKAFKYPEQLKRHKLCHTLGMKFLCEICEKSFVKDYELQKHIQVNHSNKMYVCEFCGSRCGLKHTLQRHYKRKHNASAHLVDNAEYLESRYQEVDIDNSSMNRTNIVSMVELMPQAAAEALSSLSTSVGQQTVISNEVAQLISQDGTIVQLPGHDNMFTIPTSQGGGGDEQTVVILQIVNPQEQQIEVQEMETQVIDTMELETTSQDVTDYQYTENIISTS